MSSSSHPHLTFPFFFSFSVMSTFASNRASFRRRATSTRGGFLAQTQRRGTKEGAGAGGGVVEDEQDQEEEQEEDLGLEL